MTDTVRAIEAEYRRYRGLAERAAAQLPDGEFLERGDWGNSVATLMRHLGGNLASRFTDFLTADGEKDWRDREGEFRAEGLTRAEVLEAWEAGWGCLFGTLETLSDGDLDRTVRIRGVELRVEEALLRSVAHVSYHVGQIVQLARRLRGEDWSFLSIPPGGTDAYNQNPGLERAGDHAEHLGGER